MGQGSGGRGGQGKSDSNETQPNSKACNFQMPIDFAAYDWPPATHHSSFLPHPSPLPTLSPHEQKYISDGIAGDLLVAVFLCGQANKCGNWYNTTSKNAKCATLRLVNTLQNTKKKVNKISLWCHACISNKIINFKFQCYLQILQGDQGKFPRKGTKKSLIILNIDFSICSAL